MSNVFITGVSRGLGFKIAENCLEQGYTVYGISRSLTDDVENLLEKFKTNFFWKQCDLLNVDSLHDTIFKDYLGFNVKIDGFVNNAALAYDDLVTNLHVDELVKMYDVNVFSPMILTKYVIRNMLYHRTLGSIVHISSISVHTGYKGLAMYASSKGALEAFSKNTAREWGGRGIRSNCVVAGFMDPSMSMELSEEQRCRIYKRTALKKAVSLDSVASAVEYLLSDKSCSVTGQNIFVDSGTI